MPSSLSASALVINLSISRSFLKFLLVVSNLARIAFYGFSPRARLFHYASARNCQFSAASRALFLDRDYSFYILHFLYYHIHFIDIEPTIYYQHKNNYADDKHNVWCKYTTRQRQRLYLAFYL
jgi:hypothetical protein